METTTTKRIAELKEMGLSTKKAMLFVRSISQDWYLRGYSDGMFNALNNESIAPSFDTQFSKQLIYINSKKEKK